MGQLNQLRNKVNDLPASFFLSLAFLGMCLVIFGESYIYFSKRILSFSTIPPTTISHSSDVPVTVHFGSAKIDLLVESGKIVNGVWQISASKATFLGTSAKPGEKGNIIIYGHNKKSIFGNLTKVKVNDIIEITTSTQKTFEYKVSSIDKVKPDDVSVVLPTNEEILTVYTCTGFLDSFRLVVKARPIE